MAQRRALGQERKTIRKPSGPLGIVVENGRTVSPLGAEVAKPTDALSPGAKAALSAIGGWSGLDWDETIETLERIRRENKPSPPLDDL